MEADIGSFARERPSPLEPLAAIAPVRAASTLESFSEPRSGRATPRGRFGVFWYVKRLPVTVTGASGSSAERKLRNAFRPLRRPKRCCSASATGVQLSSIPPPLPKMPPTSEAVAIRSSGFHASGPCGRLMAAYSPGSLDGSSRVSEMYWLMPAT